MKPKSKSLFHFTKSAAYLKSILKNGIYPRFCLEDNRWWDLWDGHVAFPMACFCDIPISRIAEHSAFYGSYGIGLSREWGSRNKLNPVLYVPQDGHLPNFIKTTTNLAVEQNSAKKLSDEDFETHCDSLYMANALVKPIKGEMIVSGNVIEKEFYQENEWRYVVPKQGIIEQKDFDKNKEEFNKRIETSKLEFTPSDVSYIFVREDAEIPEIVDFINQELDRFPGKDLKILISRIVSLDSIMHDL
jgi:hypothetical protein